MQRYTAKHNRIQIATVCQEFRSFFSAQLRNADVAPYPSLCFQYVVVFHVVARKPSPLDCGIEHLLTAQKRGMFRRNNAACFAVNIVNGNVVPALKNDPPGSGITVINVPVDGPAGDLISDKIIHIIAGNVIRIRWTQHNPVAGADVVFLAKAAKS